MTRSRLRPGYSVSSRSRVVSSVTRSGYGNPLIPRSRASSEYYSPISKASSGYYDSAAFDYAMDDTLSRSNYISSAAIDDFYDTSARSRGKDRRLLDETTTAIPLSASPPVYLGQTRTSQSLPNRRFLDSPRSSFIPRSIVRPYTSVVADTPAPRPRLSTIDLEASAPPRPSSLTLGSTWRQLNAAVKRPAYEAETEDLDDYLDDLGKPVSTSTDCAAASTSSSLSLRPRRLPKPPPPFVPSPYTSARAREALASAPDVRPFPNYFPPSASPSSSLSVTTLPSVREFLNSDSRVHPPGAASSLFPEDPMASRVRPPFHLAPLPARLSPSPPESDDEYGEGATATARRRRHHRVLGSKKRTGNYYERLKRRRAGREGSSRYWPYYDVESIGSSDVNGVLSDLDSLDGYDITGDYYVPDDDEDTEDYALATGGATGGEIDLDAEYVPFAPRRRYRLESPGILDLSPLASRAGSPERLTLPVPLSYRPTEASSLLTKSSAANDLMLGSMASSLATRAKSSFRDVDFSGYDHASLLVGVEGDLAVKHSGDKYGFKFYTPPISLKGAGLGSRYLGALTSLPEVTSYPRASSSSQLSSASSRPPTHDFFLDYLTRLQGLRSDVRSRLESEGSGEGKSRKRYPYASETPYTKHPSSLSAVALPSPSSYDHSTSYVPIKIDKTETVLPVTTYRKRLGGGLTHRLDVIPLPETERALPASNLLSLPRSQKLSPLSRDSREGPVEVSVLDKIKIKAAIVASKLEMEEPRRRRPRSKFAADKLRSVRLESLETQGRANYPASQPQNTYGLRASKPPLPKPSDRKSIRDVDGFTKPKNMLSWQYRLESRVDPADIYHPGAFSRMRHQILDAQDKMDRHRQMLDRYLPAESGSGDSVEGSILRKMEELEKRDPLGASKGWN